MTVFGIVVGLATLLFAVLTFLQGRASERRALEARNVVWTRKLVDDEWHFSHSGSLPVSEVKIVLTVDGDSSRSLCDELRPDHLVVVSNETHTRHTSETRKLDAEYDRELEEWQNPTPDPRLHIEGFPLSQFMTDPEPIPRVRYSVQISATFTWRYPSGVPGIHEMSWVEEY